VPDALACAFEAYRQRQPEPALAAALRLRAEGRTDPLVLGIIAHLGAEFGAESAAEEALAALGTQPAALIAELRATVGARLRESLVWAGNRRDDRRVESLAALAALLFPELCAPIQALGEPGQPFDLEPRANPRLLSFEAPPPGQPHRPRPVVVAVCERTHPANPRSRRHEIGPLLVAAMESYGWRPQFLPLSTLDDPLLIAGDWRRLLACCRGHRAEAVVIQDFRADSLPPATVAEFGAELRAACPGIRIIGLYLDPWDRGRWPGIAAAAPFADRLWSRFPAVELWQRPELAGRMLFIPLPHEGNGQYPPPAAGRGLILSFVGGIDASNWPRALWLSALRRAGVPCRTTVTHRVEDELPALESYRRYMKGLAAGGAALNFATRLDGSRIATGRVFEAILSGALLVEEAAPEVEYYFTPNRHYLSFATLGELLALARRFRTEPERMQAIRRQGWEFFQSRYRDRALIGYLDRALFFAP
jgi:hypothetical protein